MLMYIGTTNSVMSLINFFFHQCGSTEHKCSECTLKQKGSEFSHATCFICGEMGHIAKECSDNPRGLYPKGGACRVCGSVEHLRKDCPDLQVRTLVLLVC